MKKGYYDYVKLLSSLNLIQNIVYFKLNIVTFDDNIVSYSKNIVTLNYDIKMQKRMNDEAAIVVFIR